MTHPRNPGGLGLALTLVTSLALLGGCQNMDDPKAPVNADFYKPDGSFDQDAAKAAYYALMESYDYPIPDFLKGEDFWVLDFGLGNFAEVGMGGTFWINNVEHDYLGHEIFLLPGQMIPEHWHVATESCRAKVEAWHLRYGSVTLMGEGEPTPGFEIPPMHREIATARKATVLKPGETSPLPAPLERHFMIAGPQGAIVSEYASAHDMAGLRFTHPGVKLD
jgi:D-lyxose ketol-isomerase